MEFSITFNKRSNNHLHKRNAMEILDQVSSDHSFEENKLGDWIIWIGDYILPNEYVTISKFLSKQLSLFSINELLITGGNYYCIYYQASTNKLQVFTGFLNIMPIYYFESGETINIASKPDLIAGNSEFSFPVNNEFVLEKLLFNYSFTNTSIYNGIIMLKGNHYLQIDEYGLNEIQHTDILDWVAKETISTKNATSNMVDLLNERIDAYLPNEEFYLSFTGGFDGRTILSRALDTNKSLRAYSFGVTNAPDVTIPLRQSERLGVNFTPFYLDSKEYIDNSMVYGLEMVDASAGLSNFARAHYVYAAKKISKTNKYIVTGNFGSELFRAFHNTGVMVSPFLFGLFTNSNIDQFLDQYEYPELEILNPDEFKDELINLKNILSKSKVFKKEGFTKNQIFYKYVFEDIFRKYFGAEITMQTKYLYNRTPFIDYTLIKELLKTELAGIYSEFYENNPMKRLKGQLLYARCIKSNSSQLYQMKTGKGYAPKSIVIPAGKIYLFWNLLNKKIAKRKLPQDEFGVSNAFTYNQKYIRKIASETNYLNRRLLEKALRNQAVDLNNIINAISLSWYINKHFKQSGE